MKKKNKKITKNDVQHHPELHKKIDAHYAQKMDEIIDRMIIDILAPESLKIKAIFIVAAFAASAFAFWQFFRGM